LARHKASSREYALKVIDKQHIIRHNAVDAVRRERNILDRIDDPGVVQLFFTFQDALSLYLGLEYCPGGELYDQIRASQGGLPTDLVRFYAAEIVLILECLRKYDVVHRDLKPENLLLSASGHLKLIDFGSAKDVSQDAASRLKDQGQNDPGRPGDSLQSEASKDDGAAVSSRDSIDLTSVSRGLNRKNAGIGNNEDAIANLVTRQRVASLVGTADYVSPEVLQNCNVGFSADLWALGCVIYQMLAGKPPFKAASEYLTFQKIVSVEYDPLPERVCPQARDLVEKLLQQTPSSRLGHADMADLKRHAFFTGIDWSTLREDPAPTPVFIDTDSIGSAGSSFDWELASLAAALPAWGLENKNPIDLDEFPLKTK
jgi:3-phosphoinositide dependent protein kinase-1